MIPQKLFLFHYGALEMTFNIILQKTAFSLVKGRLALGSPGCCVGCLSPCRKWPNTQDNLYLSPGYFWPEKKFKKSFKWIFPPSISDNLTKAGLFSLLEYTYLCIFLFVPLWEFVFVHFIWVFVPPWAPVALHHLVAPSRRWESNSGLWGWPAFMRMTPLETQQ